MDDERFLPGNRQGGAAPAATLAGLQAPCRSNASAVNNRNRQR
jgi:hypothetical protein